MTARELGILLLCADFAQMELPPLSLRQYLQLQQRVRQSMPPRQPDQMLTPEYLVGLGYGEQMARRICMRMQQSQAVRAMLTHKREQGIWPVVWGSSDYPQRCMERLGSRCPPVLFCSGNPQLLQQTGISLVGARKLRDLGAAFARRVGQMAAAENLVLISGNAVGADRTAQEACLQAGGSVVCFVADTLEKHRAPADGRVLYCSELGFSLPFTASRALSRNRLIHAQGNTVFVAQAALEKGGTWQGTRENLCHGWSDVYLCDDGSAAMQRLAQLGGILLGSASLQSLRRLLPQQASFFVPDR